MAGAPREARAGPPGACRPRVRTRSAWRPPPGGPGRTRGAARAAARPASTHGERLAAAPARRADRQARTRPLPRSRRAARRRRPAARRRCRRRSAAAAPGSGPAARRPRSSRGAGPSSSAVLEDAAGQDDGVDARSRRPRARRPSAVAAASALWKRAATRAVPRRRARGRATTARTVGRASSTSGVPALRASERAAGTRPSLARVGRRLELDRGLALVVDLGAHAAERRDRVEQPAGARGERRGHARSHELRHLPPAPPAPRVPRRPRGSAGGSP